MANPEQQGLKQLTKAVNDYKTKALMANPEQQGLKRKLIGLYEKKTAGP